MNDRITLHMTTTDGKSQDYTVIHFTDEAQYRGMAAKMLEREWLARSRGGWIVRLPDGRDETIRNRGRNKDLATFLTILEYGLDEPKMSEGQLLEFWRSNKTLARALAGTIGQINDPDRINSAKVAYMEEMRRFVESRSGRAAEYTGEA